MRQNAPEDIQSLDLSSLSLPSLICYHNTHLIALQTVKLLHSSGQHFAEVHVNAGDADEIVL